MGEVVEGLFPLLLFCLLVRVAVLDKSLRHFCLLARRRGNLQLLPKHLSLNEPPFGPLLPMFARIGPTEAVTGIQQVKDKGVGTYPWPGCLRGCFCAGGCVCWGGWAMNFLIYNDQRHFFITILGPTSPYSARLTHCF